MADWDPSFSACSTSLIFSQRIMSLLVVDCTIIIKCRKNTHTRKLVLLDPGLDLKESLEVVDLEQGVDGHNDDLEQTPPLDTGVGGLCSVAVDALTNDNVALLVFHGLDVFRQLSYLGLQGSGHNVVLAHVDDTVHVERHVLGAGGRELVGEAVLVSAGALDLDRHVAVCHARKRGSLNAAGVGDLKQQVRHATN